MARKHRKLFPDPAITSTNQTQECSDFCEPACPNYNCYAYPYYYFSAPPISADNHSSPGNHLSSNLIILASLFTFIFVLVGFYMIKVKCYAHWCGWRVNRSAPSQSDNYSEDEFLNENQVDHPIWLITTIGLQKSIINSITVCKYRKGEGLIEGTECSVCLSEFQEGETLRLLPKCNHAFHIPCIDTWLSSHTNCPLCRAGILSNNVSPEAAMPNLASLEQNGASWRRNQETQMENTRNDGEVNNNMLVIVNGASENRARTGEAGEDEDFTDESNSKERANLNENQQVLNDEIQTEPGSDLVDDTEQLEVNILKQDGDCSTMFKRIRRSSIVGCLHISPVSMKRSFSCSGRILSMKCYRNLNSTLPH